MRIKEFLTDIKKAEIDEKTKKSMLEVYGEYVPEDILAILSYSSKPELFDENESRTLSLREVLQAEKIFKIPFASIKYIPIVDKGNNDFIIYDGEKKKWAMYNILEESVFDESDTIDELIY